MSKRITNRINCPVCDHPFDFTLFRSIWGEYPANRALVMNNEINVANCPSCRFKFKVPYPFIFTNAEQYFAVWWEPEHDPQVDLDAKEYAVMMGEGNYLAKAPRIRDWDEFKSTIIRYERGELKSNPLRYSPEPETFFGGSDSPGRENKKRTGCFPMLLLFVFPLVVFMVHQMVKRMMQ